MEFPRSAARHVAQRIVCNFGLLAKTVPPAVRASYLRVLWNGVPTSQRMASMLGFRVTNCVFNCSVDACDSLKHYFHCPRLRAALQVCHVPHLLIDFHRVDTLFGVAKGMNDRDKVLAARILHTMLRLIHFARRTDPSQDFEVIAAIEWRKSC